MNRPFALAALSAALLSPLATHASPKHWAVQVAVPGLTIAYGHPGFGVAVPAYPAAPVYAPAYTYAPVYGYAPAPVYRPPVTYPVAVPYYPPAPTVVYEGYRGGYHHRHRWHEHHGHWR